LWLTLYTTHEALSVVVVVGLLSNRSPLTSLPHFSYPTLFHASIMVNAQVILAATLVASVSAFNAAPMKMSAVNVSMTERAGGYYHATA
jgi:hypothetical protein